MNFCDDSEATARAHTRRYMLDDTKRNQLKLNEIHDENDK